MVSDVKSANEPTSALLKELGQRPLRTRTGEWTQTLYYDGQQECVSLHLGDMTHSDGVLCRIHSYCYAAHALLSIECDCSDQMLAAQELMQQRRGGVIVVLPQDSRGFGLWAGMTAIEQARHQGISQSAAYKALRGSADGRTYETAAAILHHLGVRSVELLTDNPVKQEAVRAVGIEVRAVRSVKVEDLTGRPELRDSYADKREQGYFL